jgi:hypothetical protein
VTPEPLVSVVTIFRDAEPFLEEAARSVLDQSWPRLELLLVDDGSTDASATTAEELAAAEPDRVRLLRHPGGANRGRSASRRLGIEAARGDLIAFLDGDDVWDVGHLEHEVRLLQAAPEARMVIGRAVVWRSWCDPDAVDGLTPLPAAPGTIVQPPDLLAAVLRNGETRTPTCSLLVEADALRASGGPVSEFTGMFDDQVLLARLQVRYPAVVSPATSARYRQHDRSVTAEDRAARHAARAAGGPSENLGRARFYAWLRTQPEFAPSQLPPDVARLIHLAAAHPARVAGSLTRLRAWRARLRRARRRIGRTLASSAKGRVRFGSLATMAPLADTSPRGSETVAEELGLRYLERLWRHDVRGDVLSLGTDLALRLGEDRVDAVEVDLTRAKPGAFDCVVVNGSSGAVDPDGLLRAAEVVRPGGSMIGCLAAVPTAPRAEPSSWLATAAEVRRVLSSTFEDEDVVVAPLGNVLTSIAAMHGLSAAELDGAALRRTDERFPTVVAFRALKRAHRSVV